MKGKAASDFRSEAAVSLRAEISHSFYKNAVSDFALHFYNESEKKN